MWTFTMRAVLISKARATTAVLPLTNIVTGSPRQSKQGDEMFEGKEVCVLRRKRSRRGSGVTQSPTRTRNIDDVDDVEIWMTPEQGHLSMI
jgi:hypothetical protein